MAKDKKEKNNENKVITFTKEALLGSKKYIFQKDILNTLLKDNNEYTFEEVDKTIEDFKKTEIKE